ncbi:MAG: type II toxin-antitoxin system VapC family toxin [Bryobacteraceae bacterium]
MIVLDTNVLSEVLRPRPSTTVLGWMKEHEPTGLCLTTITQAELLHGVELLPKGKRRDALESVLTQSIAEFAGRILPFDEEAARIYPMIVAARNALGRPIDPLDAMIASIARSIRAPLATRNTRDFEHCNLRLMNPWGE